ncbi:MAG: hypothetical protein OXF20_13545 [Gammaproteobacteria bacterium]|nr:hypothetical protein [Gammaproteobacteria bacterium]
MKFIISAYRAEAESLLDFSDFVFDKSIREFQVFRSGQAVLGISGEGKKQAEKLTALLISRYVLDLGVKSSLWFNFGVAGSGSHVPGSLVYASRVVDAETKNQWELLARDAGDVSVATLNTVTKPSNEYQEGMIYDMEASGILSALSSHSLARQALVLKLISDGPDYPFHCLTKSDIVKLLGDARQKLYSIIHALQQDE